jgi:predicted phage terminase large subunit-like protein
VNTDHAAQDELLRAAKRMLATKRAHEHLLDYMKLTMPDPEDIDDSSMSRYEETPVARLLCQIMEKVFTRKLKRVCVSVGPQLGKSQVISRGGPAWMMGKNPYLNIILGTYNQPFANEFGDAVREIMNSPASRQIFEGVYLRKGGKAKDLLITMSGGRAAFVGRGGSGTGKPADIFIVDDPLKDDIEAQSDSTREEVWNWFNKVALTRCHDKSSILVVHCMTGDTPITMGDGTRRRLDAVRPDDEVLAWQDGAFVRKKVLNFAEQGEDDVLEIRTGSSRVRANARHPFLCMRMGEAVWVKAGELKVGDMLVTSAVEPDGAPARVSITEAWLLGFMFGDGWLTRRDTTQINTQNGRRYPRRQWVTCAAFCGKPEEDAYFERAFEHVFGFVPKRTKFGYWRTERQAAGKWFAEHGLVGKAKTKALPQWMFGQPYAIRRAFVEGMLQADGTIDKKGQSVIAGANEQLIRDFRHLARSVGFCVSNALSWSGRVQPPNSPAPVDTTIWSFKWGMGEQTKAFHTKPIRSITPAGREIVYDIQVEGAENFIADGLVTHNTRWHQDDLIGRLCDPNHPERNGKYKGIADRWTHINLPAVVDDPKLAQALGLTLEPPTDPFVISMFGTKPMSSLWPNRKGLPFLAEAKQQDRAGFGALYMGQPTPEDGDYFKAVDLVEYNTDELPENLTIYGASDHAVGLKQRNDSTVLGCIGVDEKDTIWVLPTLVWGKMPTDQTVEELIQQFKNHQPQVWWMESEMISKSFGPFLLKRMEEEGVYTPVEPVMVSKDKSTRGRSIQGRIQMRKVRFPREAVWWAEARRQMLMFPNGAHDDFVDWLAHIGQGLLKQIAPDARMMQNVQQPVRTGSIEWILRRAKERADREKTEKRAVGW